MKNIWFSVLLIIVFSWLISLWGIWWLFTIPCFCVGLLISRNSKQAFWVGFTGIFFLWSTLAAFSIFKDNTSYVGQVLLVFTAETPLKNAPSFLTLALIYVFIAGVLGALATLTGFNLRRLVK